MKTFRFLSLFCFVLFCNLSVEAQRGGGRHGGHPRRHNKVVVVKRSPYRPVKVVVYHPHWGPTYSFRRRWVYFPAYNLYWDNWRNHYVFWNGSIWLSQAAVPAAIVNVNLNKERSTELSENDDDDDDIYRSNDNHKNEYSKD